MDTLNTQPTAAPTAAPSAAPNVDPNAAPVEAPNPLQEQSMMTKREPAQPEQAAQVPQPVPAAAPQIPDPVPEDTPTDIVGMVGQELMQDPSSSIAVRHLQTLIEGKDVDIARAFGAAYEHEDPTRIDKAYLEEKLGADATQVLEIAEFLMSYADTVASRMETDFYNSVEGGKEGLEQAAAIFNQVADKETRAIVADMLDSADMKYMQYAAKLMQQTASTAGGAYKHKGFPARTPAAAAPLTRAQYVEALQNPNLTDSQYNELRTRYAMNRK